jgi:hypothetical protein
MPTYAESNLELIDQRITAGLARVTKMGTVQWVSPGELAGDPGLYAATVVFDGSSGTAQPVKCPYSVIVAEGDRVGLVRYEGEWLITVDYTLRTLGDGSYDQAIATVANTTSTVFVDIASPASAIVPIKYRDSTLLRVTVAASMFTSAIPCTMEWAAYISSTDGATGYDETILRRGINTAAEHTQMVGWSDTAALPGGVGYAATVRWRRVSGTATLNMDGNDSVHVRLEEVSP